MDNPFQDQFLSVKKSGLVYSNSGRVYNNSSIVVSELQDDFKEQHISTFDIENALNSRVTSPCVAKNLGESR